MRCATVITAFLIGSIAWTSGAIAVEKPPYEHAVPVEQGPYLDKRSGSYFELKVSKGIKPTWSNTRALAAQHSYQGRQGRLAIVRDHETLEFIRETFRFNEEAWIGMQFFCRFRKLLWVTGEIQPLNSPGMWAPTWYRSASEQCSNQHFGYMPVYLTKEGSGPAVSWQASGPAKYFKSYIVEYPAPESDRNPPEKAENN